MRDFARSLHELYDASRELELGGSFYRSGLSSLGRTARSESSLGLDTSPTPTTLSSFEEINTIPTSYSPEAPDWVGNSNANPTIGGIYNGANGDTTLTFRAVIGGRVGQDPILIEVRDSQGALVDTISMLNEPPDTVFTLSNDLEVSFDNGQIRDDDTFTLDVFNSIPESVDPNARFNGAGGEDPNFEDGHQVTSGSFLVNGVLISVQPSDTVLTVLDKITSSAAGVTATFDFATEQVVLTQNTPGSGETITLANDTSGFLAAVKLDSASPVPGAEDESGATLADVAAFAGLQTGTFRINGIDIAVDVDQDTLLDVLDRINASAAGVTAIYDAGTQRVTILPHGNAPLTLENGDSGFFDAVKIQEGTYQRSSRVRTRFRNQVGFRRALADYVRAFEEVFKDDYAGFGAATVESIRSDLETALASAFEDVLGERGSRTLRSGLGIDYVSKSGDRRELRLSNARLTRALRTDSRGLARFLFAEEKGDGADGVVAALNDSLRKAATRLETILGPENSAGLRLDTLG